MEDLGEHQIGVADVDGADTDAERAHGVAEQTPLANAPQREKGHNRGRHDRGGEDEGL